MLLQKYDAQATTNAGGSVAFTQGTAFGNNSFLYAILYSRDAVAPLDAAADLEIFAGGRANGVPIWSELNFQAAGASRIVYPRMQAHDDLGALINEYGAYPKYVLIPLLNEGVYISVTNGGASKVASFSFFVITDPETWEL